jgi:phage terminase large subunit-like protein
MWPMSHLGRHWWSLRTRCAISGSWIVVGRSLDRLDALVWGVTELTARGVANPML